VTVKRGLKVLHLFSDWKWTGPAEPTVILCEALQARGTEVTLAYRSPPADSGDSIAARVRGMAFRATDQFRLQPLNAACRGFGLPDTIADLRALSRFIDDEAFDLVHVHHSHDHVLGGIAVRRSRRKPVLIRSDHKREALSSTVGNRFIVSKLTDGIITFSETARQSDVQNLPIAKERVRRVGVALELERYDPNRSFRDMRPLFDIGEDDIVIGTVARFQKYRRTDILLRALSQLVREFPQSKALLVGRSSQMKESVLEPTQRLGLESHVVLAGYQTDHYLDTLAAMDIFVFLVPGSDGTARALREGMAMAKAPVVAKQGILPELVDDGVTGFVVENESGDLLSALRTLVTDADLRARMGQMARDKALREFRVDRQAEEVEAFYEVIVDKGPRIHTRQHG
jgi:glycosyltransferase involved in cell wall biosynthesis